MQNAVQRWGRDFRDRAKLQGKFNRAPIPEGVGHPLHLTYCERGGRLPGHAEQISKKR